MTDQVQNLRNLYDIAGNLISNVLEIRKSAKLFVATDKPYFRGVTFQDYDVPGLEKKVFRPKPIGEVEKGPTFFEPQTEKILIKTGSLSD